MFLIVGMNVNFPPFERFKMENMFILGMWVGRHQPQMNMFLQPFLKQLQSLEQDKTSILKFQKIIGFDISYEQKGAIINSNVKIFVIGWKTDGYVRGLLQNMKISGIFIIFILFINK